MALFPGTSGPVAETLPGSIPKIKTATSTQTNRFKQHPPRI
jgi:hypothetical protein